MAKKKSGRARTQMESGVRTRSRKTCRFTDDLRAMQRSGCNDFFEKATEEELLAVFDESYSADLVNVLLDLKKATVRRVFERLAVVRKRGVADLVTLYHYKEYLTNPLPLRVETELGPTIPNYYAILGVPREVSEEELRNAHRLLVKAHAPEAFPLGMRKAGAERLAEIEDAYNNLRTPQKRQKADSLLPNINYLYPRRDQSWLEAVVRLIG
jgi:hypothetical protein